MVRAWIAENLPHNLRDRVDYPTREEMRPWLGRLAERGWIAPHWPTEFGGMGATIKQRQILMRELVKAGAPSIVSPGLNFVGPLLMKHGTPAQKAYHLPRIHSGEEFWAQGYSEPEAGSDLANIKTSAKLVGDQFVVTGHKVWQTWGQSADWMLTLVRTHSSEAKHTGITMLLIDMRTPGIRVLPIRTITHEYELSEVFLDDVKVPVSCLVGEQGRGWELANSLLMHERLSGGSPELSLAMLLRVKRISAHTAAVSDPVIQDRITEAEIEVMALEESYWRSVRSFESGKMDVAASSMLKFAQTRIQQSLADLLLDAAGSEASQSYIVAGGRRVSVADAFLLSRRATIFGGTREIQLNIIARRTLGLPAS